jgi:hypothetical protein
MVLEVFAVNVYGLYVFRQSTAGVMKQKCFSAASPREDTMTLLGRDIPWLYAVLSGT